MSDITERCPWCESVISRSKFLQIETKIREEEQARSAKVERQLRIQLQAQHEAEIAKQRQAAAENAKAEAAKLIAAANAGRDKLQEELKLAQAREAAVRASIKQEVDSALKLKLKESESQRQKELADQRAALEKDRDTVVLKTQADFAREREGLQKKMKEMERQLLRKTAQDLGDAAEIDLYESLREAFPDDRINRVQKGQAGADIHHDVMYKGQSCGRIVIDSKNHQGWQNGFVTKLRHDQTEAGAEHAILASTVFPAGKKELCIES